MSAPEPRHAQPYPDGVLFASAGPRQFTGRALREIAFPLGGIGTGTVSLGGRGQLRDWEIFNRPAKGNNLPYTFFAIWAQHAGEEPVARVLEARLQPPYTGSHGLPYSTVSGLLRLEGARFEGCYPRARISFSDPRLPLDVTLDAWNPLVPLDVEASGLPVAIFDFTLANRGDRPVKASVAFSLMNPIGTDGTERFDGARGNPCLGRNVNEFRAQEGLHGLFLFSDKYEPDDPRFGTMAVATTHLDLSRLTYWPQANWWGDILWFWDDFREDGRLDDPGECAPSPEGASYHGSLCLSAELAPGEEQHFPLYLTWHFPNRTNTWNSQTEVAGKALGNYYATRFADAWEVAEHVVSNLADLERRTDSFLGAVQNSTLPWYVVDAALSNLSTLRTATCMQTADGEFHAFEGCSDDQGCCPLDCTHVWNYEQATAFLFPTIAHSLRRTEFLRNLADDGGMGFRTLLPTGCCQFEGRAADGQMGCLVKLYRDWKLSGDRGLLEQLWPSARRAVEYAWREGGWDGDQDGVMEGEQHNTYDVEFFGPNPMMGAWYLAALRAAAAMAEEMENYDFARKCTKLADEGSRWLDENLFNGEYYEQQIGRPRRGDEDPRMGPSWEQGKAEPKFQVGPGCLIDQLVGQFAAHVAGLGHVLRPEHTRAAAQSIFRYNFRRNLEDHWNVQRTFALNDEAALLICTWPKGGRPRFPQPYFAEVMTGFEYAAAVLMILEGLLREGLTVVKAIRDRYDGERRSPWDEAECGHHYARAMASWALIPALSGFQYDATTQAMSFAPALNRSQFRCFWSAPTGWGVFEQELDTDSLAVRLGVKYGSVSLRELGLEVPGPLPARPCVEAKLDEGGLPGVTCGREGGRVAVRFDPAVTMREDHTMVLKLLRCEQ